MATKKKKRAAALTRREEFLASERARGLAAQTRARQEREKELRIAEAEVRARAENIFEMPGVLDFFKSLTP